MGSRESTREAEDPKMDDTPVRFMVHLGWPKSKAK